MFLGKVVGRMWASHKNEKLTAQRMLLVKKYTNDLSAADGDIVMAVSPTIDAGPGDNVLVLDEGGSARSIMASPAAPVRTIIVGITDQITIDDDVV